MIEHSNSYLIALSGESWDLGLHGDYSTTCSKENIYIKLYCSLFRHLFKVMLKNSGRAPWVGQHG